MYQTVNEKRQYLDSNLHISDWISEIVSQDAIPQKEVWNWFWGSWLELWNTGPKKDTFILVNILPSVEYLIKTKIQISIKLEWYVCTCPSCLKFNLCNLFKMCPVKHYIDLIKPMDSITANWIVTNFTSELKFSIFVLHCSSFWPWKASDY